MHCNEKFARMTGMHPEHVKTSHLDHLPHETAGHMPGTDGKVERAVEKAYGRKV